MVAALSGLYRPTGFDTWSKWRIVAGSSRISTVAYSGKTMGPRALGIECEAPRLPSCAEPRARQGDGTDPAPYLEQDSRPRLSRSGLDEPLLKVVLTAYAGIYVTPLICAQES
jgi:hypothetical protein